jgi:RimJ/RimL family protein N-acetyltransferase
MGARPEVWVEPYELRHASAFQALASDGRIAATTLVPHPYPDGGAARLAQEVAQSRQRREAYSFAVLADGAVVGSCSLKNLEWPDGQAEIGYWIGVPFWGRGYASAAVLLVTAYGFETLGLQRIVAEVLDGNDASARVLQKAGYRPVRTFANVNPRHQGAPTRLYVRDANAPLS